VPLSVVATAFAGPEYFALCLFAIAVVFAASSKSILKAIIATGAGLLVATIGIDPIAPYPRFTFDVPVLMIGVPEVPATIGLFCVAEGFRLLFDPARGHAVSQAVRSSFRDVIPIIKSLWRTILRSSVIGTIIGILPGTGAMMAAFISYGEAKRSSKNPEEFGTGRPEGIAAAQSADNAVTGGALIPMLTLGIPGDVNTLMLLGAMLVHGLIPGPALFHEESTLVYVIFMTMVLANLIFLVIGMRFAPLVAKVTQADQRYIVPVILILAITGPAISAGHVYYFWISIAFGIIGYVMEKGGYPVMAMAMAIVLGPIIEKSLRSALMLPEDPLVIFFSRPISAVFIVLAIAVVILGVYREIRGRRAKAASAAQA